LAEKLPSVIMTGVESRYFLRINGHPRVNLLTVIALSIPGLLAAYK